MSRPEKRRSSFGLSATLAAEHDSDEDDQKDQKSSRADHEDKSYAEEKVKRTSYSVRKTCPFRDDSRPELRCKNVGTMYCSEMADHLSEHKTRFNSIDATLKVSQCHIANCTLVFTSSGFSKHVKACRIKHGVAQSSSSSSSSGIAHVARRGGAQPAESDDAAADLDQEEFRAAEEEDDESMAGIGRDLLRSSRSRSRAAAAEAKRPVAAQQQQQQQQLQQQLPQQRLEIKQGGVVAPPPQQQQLLEEQKAPGAPQPQHQQQGDDAQREERAEQNGPAVQQQQQLADVSDRVNDLLRTMAQNGALCERIPKAAHGVWQQMMANTLVGYNGASAEGKKNIIFNFLTLGQRVLLNLPKSLYARSNKAFVRKINHLHRQALQDQSRIEEVESKDREIPADPDAHALDPVKEKDDRLAATAALRTIRLEGKISKAAAQLARKRTLAKFTQPQCDQLLSESYPNMPDIDRNLPIVNIEHPFLIITVETVFKLLAEFGKTSTSPGLSGFTQPHLVAAFPTEQSCVELTSILNDILNDRVDEEVRQLLRSGRGIIIDGKRCIVVSETLRRFVSFVVMRLEKPKMQAALSDMQLGMSPSGCEQIIHAVQSVCDLPVHLCDNNNPHIVLSADIKKAYQFMPAHTFLSDLFANVSLSNLWRYVHLLYGGPSAIYFRHPSGELVKQTRATGVQQGDNLGSFLFMLGFDRVLRKAAELAEAAKRQGLGTCRVLAYADNLTIVGSAKAALHVFDGIKPALEAINLELNAGKTELLCVHPVSDEFSQVLDARANELRVFRTAIKLLGQPVGRVDSPEFASFMNEEMESVDVMFERMQRVGFPKQVAYLITRYSIVHRFSYRHRCLAPELTEQSAQVADRKASEAAQKLLFDKQRLDGLSEAKRQVLRKQLVASTKSGGFGIFRSEPTLHAAFFASLAVSAPIVLTMLNDMKSLPEQQGAGRGRDAAAQAAEAAAALPSHPIFAQLHASHRNILQNNGISDENALLPELPADRTAISYARNFFNFFSEEGKGGLSQQKFQSALCKNLPEQKFDAAGGDRSAQFVKAWTNDLQLTAAGDWLSVIPSTPAKTLTDTDFQLAAALRAAFNLSTADGRKKCVVCNEAVKKEDCAHFLNCKKSAVAAKKDTHTALLRIVATAGNAVKAFTVVEPQFIKPLDGSNKRADVWLSNGMVKVLTDVHVDNVLAPSHIAKAAGSPGGSIVVSDQLKTQKYDAAAKKLGAIFIPAGMSVNGGFGKNAEQLMRQLSTMATEAGVINGSEILRDTREDIATAIQRGNNCAFIMHASMVQNKSGGHSN